MSSKYRDQLIEIAFQDLRIELQNQVEQHGGDANIGSCPQWISLISEELGEAAQQANRLEWIELDRHEAMEACYEFCQELIQVAALCVSAYAWAAEEGA